MVMKKSFKKIMAAGILATLAVGTIGATAAFADDGSDDEYKQNMDLLRDAIDSNDYDEFISVLSALCLSSDNSHAYCCSAGSSDKSPA